MKNLEAKTPKGIYLLETKEMKLTFVPFEHQRKLFYKKILTVLSVWVGARLLVATKTLQYFQITTMHF